MDEEDSIIYKFVRFCLVVALYNIIIAIITFVTKYLLRAVNMDYSNWGLIDWWFFISVFIMIGVFMLYMAPFMEKWLHQKLDNRLEKLKRDPTLKTKEKEAQRAEKAKEKEQKRKLEELKAKDRYGMGKPIPPPVKPTGGVPPSSS